MTRNMQYFEYDDNPGGRRYAIGDIHGCFSQVKAYLDEIGFDYEKDLLYSVGDLVDRGPESHKVLEWLDYPWFRPVRGNHEQMAIQLNANLRNNRDSPEYLREIWENAVHNGQSWFLALPENERLEYVIRFLDLPIAIKTGDIGIVHADVPLMTWDQMKTELLGYPHASIRFINPIIWSRTRAQYGAGSYVSGVKALVVGHTPMNEATVYQNVYHIDTGIVFSNRITILDLDTMEYLVKELPPKVEVKDPWER